MGSFVVYLVLGLCNPREMLGIQCIVDLRIILFKHAHTTGKRWHKAASSYIKKPFPHFLQSLGNVRLPF